MIKLLKVAKRKFWFGHSFRSFMICPPVLSLTGWMPCDFTSFSTVFQSYQDDGRMIMKGSVQWTPFTVQKISPRARTRDRYRSALNPLSNRGSYLKAKVLHKQALQMTAVQLCYVVKYLKKLT